MCTWLSSMWMDLIVKECSPSSARKIASCKLRMRQFLLGRNASGNASALRRMRISSVVWIAAGMEIVVGCPRREEYSWKRT